MCATYAYGGPCSHRFKDTHVKYSVEMNEPPSIILVNLCLCLFVTNQLQFSWRDPAFGCDSCEELPSHHIVI